MVNEVGHDEHFVMILATTSKNTLKRGTTNEEGKPIIIDAD
tara:strand:+ start:246 stop:368 length:123 start_codon:yes stop_codon:yes gene_type:complete